MALSLEMAGPGHPPARIRLSRCLSGPLAAAYPVSAHDIELRAPATGTQLTATLTALVPALLRADPQCRRVVLALPADDPDALGAAAAAGLRQTVEVDLPTGEFVLAVAEPAWVTAIDSDQVPGT
ncbi:hypothetical protein [Nocardia asteroides]|uniref:hypothetical protein n=1 Tax=Nocardia asteroides TaxID=1824 RepID=UPI001E314CE9|nr:hypothetical protein [Nocardia asteroides]UGT62678.1 hypothetical protein LTT61_04845 [Nocardia asteroides]